LTLLQQWLQRLCNWRFFLDQLFFGLNKHSII
jgi:hypothetical protein